MSVRGTRIPPHLQLPIAGVTPPPTEKEGQRLFPTGNFRFFRPVYKDKTPPCNNACPTGEQIQKYLDFVKHERYLDGYLTIMEDNPMPSVTGRVCYHPCETACNRAEHDEPIGIRSVERFLGDYGLNLPEEPVKETLPPLNGTTIAIVGSGPAGLAAAYHLRRRGYGSVIFEALGKPGGMLRAGIPHWHLPEEILDAEIAKLLSLGGIEIRTNSRAGQDISWDELRSYPAAFLALGQDVGRRLPVEGIQSRGVGGGLEFLREAGLGRPVQVGREVLVIGGGNTASDAARSAIRLGGGAATIVSLESEEELLIVPEDLEQAREEGVLFSPGTSLVRVVSQDGHVTGAVLCDARLARDDNGAVRPELIPGTEREVICDTILVAIGQVQQLEWLPGHLSDARRDHHRGRAWPGGRQRPGRRRRDARPVDGGGRARRREAGRPGHRPAAHRPGPHPRARRDDHAVRGPELGLLPARAADRGAAVPRGRAAPQPEGRGHPGLQRGAGGGRGRPLHELRGLQRLRQLLHRLPGRQRAARRTGERPLLDPHHVLQGLPGLRAGVPDRLPGEGARDGLRRARRT